MQKDYEKCDFRPIYRFIWVRIQDATIVTMECEYETVPKLSNGIISMTLSDLEPRFQGHAII